MNSVSFREALSRLFFFRITKKPRKYGVFLSTGNRGRNCPPGLCGFNHKQKRSEIKGFRLGKVYERNHKLDLVRLFRGSFGI